MQSKTKIDEIRKMLPQGSQKKIASETGLSLQTVCNFLNSHRKFNDDTALKILKASEKIIDKKKAVEKAKEDLINSLLV